MSLPGAALRFPRFRVLLPRTRLAYVHLRNLFTDAKRDRAARVFGYVCVWLPDQFLLFFMQEGEIVNVTTSPDGQRFHPIAIADAVALVPREAEYGEVCFHEADDELLAMIYWTQMLESATWPDDLNQDDPDAVFAYLHGTMFDGVLQLLHEGGRSYAAFHQGSLVRGYFADDAYGAPEQQVRDILTSENWVRARFWPVPAALPAQAAPALIQGYRELMSNTVRRLERTGVANAPSVAEQVRRNLMTRHPPLERLAVALDALPAGANVTTTLSFGRNPAAATKDPIVDAPALSAAVGAWLGELLWAAAPADGSPPERFLEDLLRERRHMFQMAGLFDALPWKLFV